MDGIYLSIPYIELLEEPSLPLKDMYEQPLFSTLPQPLAKNHAVGKRLLKHVKGGVQVMAKTSR